MPRQGINIGSTANDGTGDPLRTAFDKINDNFVEVYGALNPASSTLKFVSNSLVSEATNSTITIDPAGTGTIELASSTNVSGSLTVTGQVDAVSLSTDTISTASNQNLSITPGGTGSILADGITIKDNTISASNTNDNLILSAAGTGNIEVGAITVNGTTLSAADSTKITIAETLDVTGAVALLSTLSVSGGTTLVGNTTVDNITINDSTISTSSNADLNLQPGGTGNVVAGALTIAGSTISATDSTQINFNDAVQFDGNVGFYGTTPTAQASAIAFDPLGNDGSTVDDLRQVINSILTALRNVGIIAS